MDAPIEARDLVCRLSYLVDGMVSALGGPIMHIGRNARIVAMAAVSGRMAWGAHASAQSAAASGSSAAVDKVLAGAQRPAADTERDVARHPKETLAFFGVNPKGSIAEIDPLGGYYAR